MLTYIALGIFAVAFALIVFDLYDKSIVALSGALLMVVFRILTPEEAIAAVQFETILLLMAMMLIVNMASKSGIFGWVNVKIASLTRGNPLAIFLFFSLVTAFCSAFLDNVTTVVLIVPLIIELVRGMGKDPKPYIFAAIMFSNIGGALTLVGDSSNIIIGGATGLNFFEFISNLWIPILMAMLFATAAFMIWYRKELKPIANDLFELFLANIIIKKVKVKFLKTTLHKDFVIKVIGVITLTILGFLLQAQIGLPTYVIGFSGAMVLGILSFKQVDIHHAFQAVEWTTLFFFAGLFIMVGGVEKTGVLLELSHWIASSTDNILYLSWIVLWSVGIASMLLDNVPFVTIMLPVIAGIQSQIIHPDIVVLWWALSMGACLGGNGTLIGASANVVSADIARKHGVNITFLNYMKFALPVTLCILMLCSVYLYFRLT